MIRRPPRSTRTDTLFPTRRSSELVGDEGPGLGGKNLGPAPYDFLLAGLGACTAITLRMYADRKDWPLESVEVGLKLVNQDGLRIDRVLTIAGLDAAQKARLADIAESTPGTRPLKGGLPIDTRLAWGQEL